VGGSDFWLASVHYCRMIDSVPEAVSKVTYLTWPEAPPLGEFPQVTTTSLSSYLIHPLFIILSLLRHK